MQLPLHGNNIMGLKRLNTEEDESARIQLEKGRTLEQNISNMENDLFENHSDLFMTFKSEWGVMADFFWTSHVDGNSLSRLNSYCGLLVTQGLATESQVTEFKAVCATHGFSF